MTANEIGYLAFRALLDEVYTTPKPGLVDLYSQGAHRDMDYKTFERSAAALKPYFTVMACQGMMLASDPKLLFSAIRRTGVDAENAMYAATGGVNTHKGLIFSLGILSAAAGACSTLYKTLTLDLLIHMEQQMVRQTLFKEVEQIKNGAGSSNGERNLKAYGSLGVRGEAISGYASLRNTALPVMMNGLKENRDWNQIKLQTLFTLMSQVDDSNIIARRGPGALAKLQQTARDFLHDGGAYQTGALARLKAMDQVFTAENLSAGGCADLLAAAIFTAGLTKGAAYADNLTGGNPLSGEGTGPFKTVLRQHGAGL